MKVVTYALFAFCTFGLSTNAQACRQLIPSAKFRLSDVVVDGTAKCEKGSERCVLMINTVHKGENALAGQEVDISVDLRPPTKREGDTIILRHCPQTFEPWKSQITGKFYLVYTKDRELDAAHPPDVSDDELFDFEFEERQ